MTGYGKSEILCEGKKITVEIKSLNGKQMDLSIKLPASYREKEFDIRNKISKVLLRGKVDVFINVELVEDKKRIPINEEVFQGYFLQLQQIASTTGFNVQDGSVASAILRLPDVLVTEKNNVDENEWQALNQAIEEALEQINQFRLQEGHTLITDILRRIDLIEQWREEILPFEKERIETIKKRIYDNLSTLNIDIDNNRFEQELIYYLEKLDITEEMVRLQNHLDYFRQVCQTEEAPGRKFGFICQEIGREINTTGSKANKSQIQRIVVNMKDELEKIKEQLLNLL